MRNTLTFLIALFLLATHAVAQKHYVSLNQYDNEWSITHGEDVLFHGTGKVDFNNMPYFIKHVVDSLDSVEPKRPARQLQGHTKRNVHASVVVEPLITTSWHQDAPYNDLMPTINGVHVPAGCATISTAQVINYYHYMQPWTASYDEVYYDGDLFQHENVSWYNPSEVQCPEPVWHVEYSSTGWTNDIAPAKLCEGIAFAQKAFFYANETSTNYFTHYDAIRKKFGYFAETKETDPYSISEVLKEQLDIQRPVIINAADNSNNGHSFIADGYNSEGEFHLNMGWGESWNCWGAPELWAYNQAMFVITLYPDYNDEALFIKDNEPGTAVFHNLTTGEVFRQEMSQYPVVSGQTGLPINHSNFYQVDITAGEYEFWLEYNSGKQISAPMSVPLERELFSMYQHSNPAFIEGASRLNVPYNCILTFYTHVEVVEKYGIEVVLEYFKLDSYSIGDVEINLTNQDSTLNVLIPTDYSEERYYGGIYKTQNIDNVPAGNYRISANVHSETLGDFCVGIGAGAIPCTGNDFSELYLETGFQGDIWLWTGSIDAWTEAARPYVEPLMITLPQQKTDGYYTLVLYMRTGGNHSIGIYAKWRATPVKTVTLNPQCNDGNKVYGTFSNTSAWVVPEELTVSAVCVDGESISLDNYATGDIVPANAGVLVSASEGGDYMIELSNDAGTEKSSNALVGTGAGVTAEDMALLAPGKEYFRLTMHNAIQCGFWWGAENGTAFDLGANKAFLVTDVPASQNAARGFLLDGLITAINRVETTLTKNRAFNLYGQQVNANAKGIVIVNGKKVMNQ